LNNAILEAPLDLFPAVSPLQLAVIFNADGREPETLVETSEPSAQLKPVTDLPVADPSEDPFPSDISVLELMSPNEEELVAPPFLAILLPIPLALSMVSVTVLVLADSSKRFFLVPTLLPPSFMSILFF